MEQPIFIKTLAPVQSICITMQRQRSAFVQVYLILCDVETLQYEIMFYKPSPKFIIRVMHIKVQSVF